MAVISPFLAGSMPYRCPTPSPFSGSWPTARKTLPSAKTGVAIPSLRVFGQTASFGLRSNFQIGSPVLALKP